MSEDSATIPTNYMALLRKRAVTYLEKWIGHFYLFGGDDPSGFDCSGLIVEVLQSVGMIRHKSDYTADGLWHIFKRREVKGGGRNGCLIFWFNNTQEKAIHVEMLVDNYHSIGASGGGRKTRTIADAIKHNAFVKMRPKIYRGLNFKVCDPFKR
ncbi:unnamed protein product [marine sediment metagenome]|uniref:NlpC/P60 domain-containing protein n=1 Tax=marine sediment metagenome TaxID=412755 RepID=X0XDV4_9ZZZZ